MKSLFRTVLLSILLFLIVVFLGVKYHWIQFFKTEVTENKVTLEIPGITKSVTSNLQNIEENEEFDAQIVKNKQNESNLSNLTKQQIILACQTLASTKTKDSFKQEMFIGNCVVSNYNETYLETNNNNIVKSISNVQRTVARRACLQKQIRLGKSKSLSALSIELLTGICVSNVLEQ